MNILTPTQRQDLSLVMLALAREIACDIHPLEKILDHHDISADEFAKIKENPAFDVLLQGAISEWNSAHNTADRVKIKSAAFIEEALPELYARAHDPKEPLSAKVELVKAVSRFAGIGGSVDAGTSTERMVVNINLGADHKLTIEKDVSMKVVEGEARRVEADEL